MSLPLTQSRSNRVAKNTLYLFFRMFLVTIVGLYTSRAVLDAIGVSDYGIYNVVGSLVILFSFLQQALTNATFRFFTYSLGEGDFAILKKTFSMSINVHIILALIILLLAETIGTWVLNTYLSIPEGRMIAANVAFQFSIGCFCLSIIKTPFNSCIIAHEKMNFYAYTSIVEVIAKLLIVVLLYKTDVDKLILYALLLFIIDALLFGWFFFHCKISFEECKYHFYWEKNMLIKMLKYSGWSVLVNAADVCVTQSIVFMFNIFFGVLANAALGVANQVTSKVTMLLGGFTQAFNPQIIKSYASNDKQYMFELIYSTSKISFFLLLIICIPLLLNIDFILNLWLVEVPLDTSVFVLYSILYALVDAYSAPLWLAVHATGNLRAHQIIMSCIKVLNIPLAYLMLLLGFDAWTALALKVSLNIVCSIVRPIYMRTLIQLPLLTYLAKVIIPILFVTLLTIPIPIYLSLLFNDSWQRFLITSGCSIIISLFTIIIIGLNKKERMLLANILHFNKVVFK